MCKCVLHSCFGEDSPSMLEMQDFYDIKDMKDSQDIYCFQTTRSLDDHMQSHAQLEAEASDWSFYVRTQ